MTDQIPANHLNLHCDSRAAPRQQPAPARSGVLSARRALRWLLLWLALLQAASLQAANGRLDGYYRETWTTREGLPHNTVNAITQTADGYLWLGTWEGVARYSGHSFRNFDRNSGTRLPDSAVRALLIEPDGSLLVGGGRGGLARLRHGEWSALPLAPRMVTSTLRDRAGQLWVGTDGAGLMRLDREGQRHHFAVDPESGSGSVHALLEDAFGRIWVGSSRGLMLVRGDRLDLIATFRHGQGTGRGLALALDGAGRLLVGGDAGLFVSRGALVGGVDGRLEFEALHPRLVDKPVAKLLWGRGDHLWIGTRNEGLYRLGERGLEHLDTGDGLPNNRILALFEDREGSLWIGTNGGLVRLGDAPFSSLTVRQGLTDDFVRSVLELDDGRLLIATSEGLNQLLDGELTHFRQAPELRRRTLLSLAHGANGFWVGTQTEGALRIADGKVVQRITLSDGLPSNEIRALHERADGSLWIGTARGLAHWRTDAVSVMSTLNGLPADYVMSLHEDAEGELWVGTANGLARVVDGRAEAVNLAAVEGVESIFDISEDALGEALWLASDRGLLHLRRGDGRLSALGYNAGLPFEKFFHVADDGQGGLWLSGNRGVLRVDLKQARAVADGQEESLRFEQFTESDGMASAQCNGGSGPAGVVRADGSVWFATAKGVSMVDPSRLERFAQRAPPVVIQSVLADNTSLGMSMPVEVAAGTSRIEIGFAAVAFVMPQRVLYRYRLEGFDTDWVERGALRSAVFTNLFPGTYTLRVQAAHPDGPWSEREAKVELRIAPLWWQRKASWLLLSGLFALGVWMLISRRVRVARANEDRLRDLVELRTTALQSQAAQLLKADAERGELLQQLQVQAEAFERQAREDALTGLGNRRAFDELLAYEFTRTGRCEQPLCVALLDLDHFKQVNDKYSHSVGDDVLRAVAQRMRSLCREIDTVSRWGGEEFALLLPNTKLSDALAICERVRSGIERMEMDDLHPGLKITVSIGIASHEGHPDYDRMLSQVDAALYAAKAAGRNRIAC